MGERESSRTNATLAARHHSISIPPPSPKLKGRREVERGEENLVGAFCPPVAVFSLLGKGTGLVKGFVRASVEQFLNKKSEEWLQLPL